MKRTLILTLCVLAASLAVCLWGGRTLDRAIREAEALRSAAVLAAETGEGDRAKELMLRLAELWRERNDAMEMLASHDALHEVTTGILEAQICLECGDHDDFLRNMAVMGEALGHLRDEQAFRLSNLS